MGRVLDRIEPSALDEGQADALLEALAKGEKLSLPEPYARALASAIRAARRGENVVVASEGQDLTTQEAADYLGVSRPFLVGLLEKGDIPFHRAGTHRRVRFADLKAYGDRRDADRRKALDDLFDEIDAAGLYWLGLDENLGCEE